MHTDDLIDLCTTIPLWVVVAMRAYARPSTPGQRAIFGTFLVLAVAATLRLAVVEDALIDLTGMKDAAVLPKHLAVMLACTLLIGWVESVVPPRENEPAWRRWVTVKPRMIMVITAGIAASIVFPYSAPSLIAPDGSRDFASAQAGDIAGSTHLGIYLLAMAAAQAPSALLCLEVAKRTDDKTLRVCMRLMAAGAAVGVSYSFYRLSFLWCGFTGVDYPLSEAAFHRGGSLIQLFTFALVIVGSSVRAVDLTLRAIRHRRALIELRPLWQELVSVLPPDTIRRRLQTTPSASEERRRFRDLYGRLDERVVDISDACFELLPWVGDDLSRNALEEARAAGLDESDIGAAQEALCLRVARHRAVEGEPYALQPAETSLTLGNDLVANAQWLARVAHYYASPELDAAAAKLTAPQEVTA